MSNIAKKELNKQRQRSFWNNVRVNFNISSNARTSNETAVNRESDVCSTTPSVQDEAIIDQEAMSIDQVHINTDSHYDSNLSSAAQSDPVENEAETSSEHSSHDSQDDTSEADTSEADTDDDQMIDNLDTPIYRGSNIQLSHFIYSFFAVSAKMKLNIANRQTLLEWAKCITPNIENVIPKSYYKTKKAANIEEETSYVSCSVCSLKEDSCICSQE